MMQWHMVCCMLWSSVMSLKRGSTAWRRAPILHSAYHALCTLSFIEKLLLTHAFTTTSRGSWIVDSGATYHMSSSIYQTKTAGNSAGIILGDGHSLEGSMKQCRLNNVLLVPKLSYSPLSVSKASSTGKTTKFKAGCEILNEQKKVIAFATQVGSLHHLEHCQKIPSCEYDRQGEQRKAVA